MHGTKYTDAQLELIRASWQAGHSDKEIARRFRDATGRTVTPKAVTSLRSRRGWSRDRTPETTVEIRLVAPGVDFSAHITRARAAAIIAAIIDSQAVETTP